MSEDQQTEWKSSWRDEYLKWLCGFANAQGGVLTIGRDDKGNAVGTGDASRLLEDLPNKVRDTLGIIASVYLVIENEKELVEVRVDPYPSPISYKGEYYCRSGSTLQQLKGPGLEQFLLKKRGRHWDSVPDPAFTIGKSSADAFFVFAKKASRSGRMDDAVLHDTPQTILDNLELFEGNYLRRAASLLFSDKPERYNSGAWIKIGFFVTDDDLRYQDEIHGNLFDQVDKTLDLLRTKYLKAQISYDGLQRVETFPVPLGALREAILNAVVHKDYSSGIPIQISVYDHQIVIWNSGQLPQGWTVEKLLDKHASTPPNPLLANALFRAGYIEAWGRGIARILSECDEHKLPPPTFDAMSGLMLTFQTLPAAAPPPTSEFGENFGENFGEDLNNTDRLVIGYFKSSPRLSARAIAGKIGLTSRTVEQSISKLKALGIIRREGPAKGGRWVVTL